MHCQACNYWILPKTISAPSATAGPRDCGFIHRPQLSCCENVGARCRHNGSSWQSSMSNGTGSTLDILIYSWMILVVVSWISPWKMVVLIEKQCLEVAKPSETWKSSLFWRGTKISMKRVVLWLHCGYIHNSDSAPPAPPVPKLLGKAPTSSGPTCDIYTPVHRWSMWSYYEAQFFAQLWNEEFKLTTRSSLRTPFFWASTAASHGYGFEE